MSQFARASFSFVLVVTLISLAAYCGLANGKKVESPMLDVVLVFDEAWTMYVREYIQPIVENMWDDVRAWLKELRNTAENMRFAVITSDDNVHVRLKFSWQQPLEKVVGHVPSSMLKNGQRNLNSWARKVLTEVFGENGGDRPEAPNVLFCK